MLFARSAAVTHLQLQGFMVQLWSIPIQVCGNLHTLCAVPCVRPPGPAVPLPRLLRLLRWVVGRMSSRVGCCWRSLAARESGCQQALVRPPTTPHPCMPMCACMYASLTDMDCCIRLLVPPYTTSHSTLLHAAYNPPAGSNTLPCRIAKDGRPLPHCMGRVRCQNATTGLTGRCDPAIQAWEG